MKTIHTKSACLALCACLPTLLAACGNSTPSESDAKHAVEAQLGDCKYVEMSDFNRVNGVQGSDDRHYQVEVQYNLTLEADSDQRDKLQAWAKKTSDRQDLINQEMQIRKNYSDQGGSAASDQTERRRAETGGTVSGTRYGLRPENVPHRIRPGLSECPR